MYTVLSQPMDTSSVSNTRVDPPAYGKTQINLDEYDKHKLTAACLGSWEVTLYLHSLAEVGCAACASLQHCNASTMFCSMGVAWWSDNLQTLTTFQKSLDPNLLSPVLDLA